MPSLPTLYYTISSQWLNADTTDTVQYTTSASSSSFEFGDAVNAFANTAPAWAMATGWVNATPPGGVNYTYMPPLYPNSVQWNVAQPFVAPILTIEEQEAQAERERDAEQARAIRNVQRQVAEQRAEELLLEHLTADQREQYRVAMEFLVISESGKRFKVKKGFVQNIFELDDAGKPLRRYCIHPKGDFPTGDAMLAQVLMLEGAEQEFLRIANVFNP